MEKKKPTVAELEAILDGPDCNVVVLPNGEIRAVECSPCAEKAKRIEELEAETKQSVKITYINAFGDLAVVSQLFEDENNKDAVNDELFEILCESGNPYLRISAAQNIGKISESGKYEQATRQKIVNKLFHVMNKDNDE